MWQLLTVSDQPPHPALLRESVCGAVGQSAAKGPRDRRALHLPGSAPQKWHHRLQLQRSKPMMTNLFCCCSSEKHFLIKTSARILQVPVPVAKINSTEHPVKVGLSDAFMAYLQASPASGQPQKKNPVSILLLATVKSFILRAGATRNEEDQGNAKTAL